MSRRKKVRKSGKQSRGGGLRAFHVAFYSRLGRILLDHEIVRMHPEAVPMVACQLTAAYWQSSGSSVPSDIWVCWTDPAEPRIFQLSAGGGFLGEEEFGFDGEPEPLSDEARAAILAAVEGVHRGDPAASVDWVPGGGIGVH